ncbi:MAG: phosphate/phosphite/phosphonate ABC transporter substrate-binding protein [Deltaproteobacteria bacterium]|nr:phosphate/phosphite/phosphonate ABC transporter substrate-binding protein [Deltaproteobacteria bacterium]
MRVSRTSFGFGIVPSFDSTAARSRFTEACELLSRQLGVVIYPHQALNYRDLAEGIERGTLGLAWLPPMLAIELEDRRQVEPIALPVRRGTTSFQSAIIAHRGAAKSLDDLRGKRVAWVDRSSAAGYVVPRMHLVGAGFDVRTLFSSESFAGTHDRVVDMVVSGRADVGATFCTMDPRTLRVLQAGWTAPDGTSPKPVDVVALTAPIPNDAIFAHVSVPTDVRAKLISVLLSPDAKLRDAIDFVLRAEAFRPATSAHFEPLRRMIAAATSRGEAPPSSRR